jgi:hypothetical protein
MTRYANKRSPDRPIHDASNIMALELGASKPLLLVRESEIARIEAAIA